MLQLTLVLVFHNLYWFQFLYYTYRKKFVLDPDSETYLKYKLIKENIMEIVYLKIFDSTECLNWMERMRNYLCIFHTHLHRWDIHNFSQCFSMSSVKVLFILIFMFVILFCQLTKYKRHVMFCDTLKMKPWNKITFLVRFFWTKSWSNTLSHHKCLDIVKILILSFIIGINNNTLI